MNLRATLLAALAAAACSITVPPQFSCPDPGKSNGCGTGEVCGPDNLCTKVVNCLTTESRCNGVCTDIVSNREHCGNCDTVCSPSEQCAAGHCQPFCAAGQTACAQTTGGFICENLSNDRANCGTCRNQCPQGQVCDGSGHCGIECLPHLTNCGQICLDLSSDDANCGACGNVCATGTHCVTPTNGNPACTVICTPGQIQCADPVTGARSCVDPTKDRDYCGGCIGAGGRKCDAGNICVNGTCTLSCPAGLTNCGGKCVDTTSDPNHCGADASCAGGAVCTSGQVCTNTGPGGAGQCVLQCPAGQNACGYPAWNSSTAYFAGNRVTSGGNLYQVVSDGTSSGAVAVSGTGSSITDGTVVWKFVSAAPASANQCINLQSDRNNCGACDDVTNAKACGSGQVCLGGACVVSCAAGLTQCNGTCVDTHNDPANCGGCGVSCSAPGSGGPVCGNGACGVSCPAGETTCGGKCVDTLTDPNHCGTTPTACGVVCAAGQVCAGGGCTLTCPSGSVACNGKCVDPLHDNGNCGADASCAGGIPCAAGTSCQPVSGAGKCVATCAGSTCNPGAANAYCADFANDAMNCNGCGKICGPAGAIAAGYPNARAFCSQSACGAACSGTFADCNGDLEDGCEIDLSNDAAHCGTCLNACPAADNANPSCASSNCGSGCQSGFGNCDNDLANGCESDLSHDAQNCGGCGAAACSGSTPYCSGGCVTSANSAGVQENLSLAAVVAEWGQPCFSESYSRAPPARTARR